RIEARPARERGQGPHRPRGIPRHPGRTRRPKVLRDLRDARHARDASRGHRDAPRALEMKTDPPRPLVRHGYALALVAVAAVWGVTFPVVKRSVTSVPPFEFLALRFTLAAVVMTA